MTEKNKNIYYNKKPAKIQILAGIIYIKQNQ